MVVLANVVHFSGFAESADAAYFYIYNPAGAGFDRGCGVARMPDGFVETYRRAEFALQARVVVNIVIPERLLDHQKVEAIELAQMFDFIQGISGVSIATEQDFRPAHAD